MKMAQHSCSGLPLSWEMWLPVLRVTDQALQREISPHPPSRSTRGRPNDPVVSSKPFGEPKGVDYVTAVTAWPSNGGR